MAGESGRQDPRIGSRGLSGAIPPIRDILGVGVGVVFVAAIVAEYFPLAGWTPSESWVFYMVLGGVAVSIGYVLGRAA